MARLPGPGLRRPAETAADAHVSAPWRCCPGAAEVYGVSVQFVTRSIESWFDVRSKKALESASTCRTALDSLLADLSDKGGSMALELSDLPEAGGARLSCGSWSAAVPSRRRFFRGRAAPGERQFQLGSGMLRSLPTQAQLKQARNSFAVTSVDLEGAHDPEGTRAGGGAGVFEDPMLQLMHPVPPPWPQNAEAVQAGVPGLTRNCSW